jgi:hypothetical protein
MGATIKALWNAGSAVAKSRGYHSTALLKRGLLLSIYSRTYLKSGGYRQPGHEQPMD